MNQQKVQQSPEVSNQESQPGGNISSNIDSINIVAGKKSLQESSNRHTVLLVDDDTKVLKAIKRILTSENYKILTAENAAEAFAVMAINDITLIISDYNMPGMKGTELPKKIKEKYPDTIRIMLTGYFDSKTAMSAVKDGAVYKFITKPWNDDDLLLTIRLALHQYDLTQENARLKEVGQEQQTKINKLKHFTRIDHSTLGRVLLARARLTPGQLEIAERYCTKRETIFAKAIIELGMIEEQELLGIIQEESKAELIPLSNTVLSQELALILSRKECELSCLVPVSLKNNNLCLAMVDPLDLTRVDYISFITRRNVIVGLATIGEIEKAIRQIYGDSDTAIDSSSEEIDYIETADDIDLLLDEEKVETVEQLMAKSTQPPAIRTVNSILSEAIKFNASDIHIEPKLAYSVVRFRVDGLLRDRLRMPLALHITTISRLKILARMDIAERRLPQDGRMTVRVHSKTVDIRVSSMPTINGEKIVCRLLDKNAAIRTLNEIGVDGDSVERLKNLIKVPQGMIIATGPTGSGKTTSLYSLLNERMSTTLNFITIEDPVEYSLERASQIHIRQNIGLTFASSLRATLRQDPDVILVGEIRDNETAEIAFQAAMTGHLVFSSLHTNSTIATISRLFHLGIEPYLVTSAVQGIFAQRLVRTICPNCQEESGYDRELINLLGIAEEVLPEKLPYGMGCKKCDNTGYLGRTGLFEVFQMSEEFRQFLISDYREPELLNRARSLGMETLLEDGLRKVVDGRTTLEELLRVLGPQTSVSH